MRPEKDESTAEGRDQRISRGKQRLPLALAVIEGGDAPMNEDSGAPAGIRGGTRSSSVGGVEVMGR